MNDDDDNGCEQGPGGGRASKGDSTLISPQTRLHQIVNTPYPPFSLSYILFFVIFFIPIYYALFLPAFDQKNDSVPLFLRPNPITASKSDLATSSRLNVQSTQMQYIEH